MSLGDLQRYILFIHENFHTPFDSSHTLKYYFQALNFAPFEGSTYRPLASLSRSQGNLFQTAYYLSLSLMTEVPLSAARDLLVEIFETSRQETEHFPVVTALSRMSPQEHLTHFKVHLLAAVGIGYSRTNADLFSLHSERCRRHLSTILQLLVIDMLHQFESGKGSKGDFKRYDELAFLQSDSNESAQDVQLLFHELCPISYEISTIIHESIIIILSLLTLVAEKSQLKDTYNNINWQQCYVNQSTKKSHLNSTGINNGNENSQFLLLSNEEKLMCEKRYILQCVNKIQTIPGLLDLSRLLLGLIASLISSEGVGMGIGTSTTTGLKPSHYNLITMSRMITTCPSINLFFDWLTEHPEFHILSLLDKVAWEQMEADLPAYLSTLTRFTTFDSISLTLKKQWNQNININQSQTVNIDPRSCLVSSDYLLQGFLPIQSLFQRRSKVYLNLYLSFSPIIERIHDINKNCHESASEIARELEMLYTICDPSTIIPTDKDYAWFIIQAHRCVLNVRNLCNTVLTVGPNMMGIYDKSKQLISPSSDRWNTIIDQETHLPNLKQCLCVITYKTSLTMRTTGFATSGYSNKQSIILTEKEFLQGSIPKELISPSSSSSSSAATAAIATTTTTTIDPESQSENKLSDLIPEVNDFDEIIVYQPNNENKEIISPQTQNIISINDIQLVNQNNTQEPSQGVVNTKGVLRVPQKTSLRKAEQQKQQQHDTLNRANLESLSYKKSKELPLIVVDTPNVAMRHGLNLKFSCRGIKLAIDFFHRAGHRVVAFLPV